MSDSWKTAVKAVIAMFLLECFILSAYHLLPLGYFNQQVQIKNNSKESCLHVLKMQNYICTVNNSMEELLMTTSVPKPLTSTEKEEPDTIVLIWMWPFGSRFGLGLCSSAFNIHGCHLTDDRGLFNQAHGVMFHHRDISWDLSNMPKLPRPAFQKWIWWNMESPTHSGQNPLLKDLFNLTSGYRRDSDIPVPYGWLSDATEVEKNYTIPKKEKLVCWVVSNYNPNHKRSQYFNELVKHINVEAHGRHFNSPINNNEYLNLVSSCKFYLSFENSIHRDYMTEKLFNSLALGTVPVVLGPSRENYEQFIPSEAFIHVDDFPSPKELADHLKLLDQNEDLYRQHFTWRKHFVSKGAKFGLEHACRICEHVRKNKHYRVVKDLNSWYWG
ncbi:4-galactosyl-N-acetylglucosaminide 3-alpha-L-fucosyltransferase 9-like [Megalobrama amblycephala]|uniref:4-galactosyl-N-acetylglucosaminide 3-alpha-L-fucosyltransferase 9-like n=1 Tax=Megalobrama amblycephala TaxID=75352 RepID=UPI002013EBE0|nr:4-galactosyl-N-acetylglucosaminide 3-alpha-L-fucosyltransferase 9-like [Megalobrama amblycephala]